MVKVLILAGGNSSEREVSLRSGRVVEAALREAGQATQFIDPLEPLENYYSELKATDVVFPALHGHGGEDGILQEYLESINVAFVGSGSAASSLCFNKANYLKLMTENDILTPATEIVTKKQFESSTLIHAPFVLKPIDEGSSIDTIIVKDLSNLNRQQIDKVFKDHSSMLLEPFIGGQEITVGILGNKALPVIEIIPPEREDFNYENKYNGKTLEICPPKNAEAAVQALASKLAEKIHKLCNCADMSRTDMIVGSGNDIYVLGTNTIPGLTDGSLLPKAAQAAGLSMPEFCSNLVEMALARAIA